MGRLWPFVVVGILGCDQSNGLAIGSECRAAAEAFAKAELESVDDHDSIRRRSLIAFVSQRCRTDKWRSYAATCIAKAVDAEGQRSCGYKHLTGMQQDKLDGHSAGASMAMMAEVRDKMCACKDADCAKRVTEEMRTWSQELAKTQHEPPKFSDADQRRATELGVAVSECMERAVKPGKPLW